MSIDDIVFLGRDAMLVTLLASAPMLLSGMVVGLAISVFQSVTQIQEITLTFVPKIVVVMLSFVLFLPWMAKIVLDFENRIFEKNPVFKFSLAYLYTHLPQRFQKSENCHFLLLFKNGIDFDMRSAER